MFTDFLLLNRVIDNIPVIILGSKSRLRITRLEFINELLKIELHLAAQGELRIT